MHFVEPFYNWRGYYIADEDPSSPFYGREYSEFAFSNTIYNFYIHPQWDEFGSRTLYLKVLFVDYELSYAIIEMIGEWNDAVENDIMQLKRSVIDEMIPKGIAKYILITENVLNFHSSDDSYYEEWIDDIEDGWVVLVNFHGHVSREMQQANIDQYFLMGGQLDDVEWRTFLPHQFFRFISKIVNQRLD